MSDIADNEMPSANVDEDWGQLYVTRRCCGAATCRNYAPELLGEVAPGTGSSTAIMAGSHDEGAFTGVLRQPRSRNDYLAARAAAAGCGFGAIRLTKPARKTSTSVPAGGPWAEWPRKLEDNVWALGQPSTKNYGAMAYFIELPSGGLLVDMPKPSDQVFRWLEEHGGVRWLFLTHKDHVQHHAEYAARFPGCRRIIGRADVNKRQSAFADATSAVEIQIASDPGPTTLEGAPLANDALTDAEFAVLPQPGHTPGTMCLLYRGKYLFTGDHLAYSNVRGHVIAHRLQCWESWQRQTDSVSRLRDLATAGQLRFSWLLPGHGEWHRFDGTATAAQTATELERTVQWMREQPAGNVPLLRWIPFVISRTKPNGRFAKLVMAIGGKGRDAWLIPRDARAYLTDHRGNDTERAVRRLRVLLVTSAAALTALTWLVAHTLRA
jgi:glyoxylase-like metal-dependent hydrolase (beta-lactamase superfamily II)